MSSCSPSNTAAFSFSQNILDVTQLSRIHTQQLAVKCRAEANISSRISDDSRLQGDFCAAERHDY